MATIAALSMSLVGCGSGSSTVPSATHAIAGGLRQVKSCNKVYSPDGCDSVDGQDVPEYIDSNGNPCDPSAPFDSNNPCELNRLYKEPVVQPQP
ncbi:MAG: hypothetical protein JOZ58_27300, partial [Acetobacteraceae bacterium]|nr:hypothetical protein [Acetobacteraceae bacterium]